MRYLCVLVLLAVALPGAADTPAMSTTVIGMQLSFEDCRSRVSSALRSRGYERTYDFGNGWIGTSDRYTSSVGCIHGNKEVVLNVVVASNDANTNEERDRIVALVRGGGGDEQPAGRAIRWSDNPGSLGLRGKAGRFTFTCTGGGSGSAWGTDVYTDDSSICLAAVHAGAIGRVRGGSVTIELLPGRSSYAGTTRHGVTTSSYGAWSHSFRFVGANVDREPEGGSTIAWTDNARNWRGQVGERVRLYCPAGGSTDATVWGSGIYTDDSAICVAAVHAGVISVRRGGDVTIQIRRGQNSYESSSRNGVSTRAYGAWPASFAFVD